MRVLPQRSRPKASSPLAESSRFDHRLTPYLFVLPFLIFFVLFRLGPSLVGLGISVTNWQAIGTPQFVADANFQAMTRDPRLADAIENTIKFTLMTVPLLVILGLALAVFLNQPHKGRAIGRVVIFMPYVIMSTVVGVLWTWMLDKDFGLVNVYLNMLFGIKEIPWLTSEAVALYSIVITTVWWTVGYNVILFLAGLQDIPSDLYEAARIDGAGRFNLFRFVTLPLLAPTTFLVLMLTIINSFQIFDLVYVMTSGGPVTATLTWVQYIYTTAFQFRKFGYGSAIAVVLVVILMVIALIQTRVHRRGLESSS